LHENGQVKCKKTRPVSPQSHGVAKTRRRRRRGFACALLGIVAARFVSERGYPEAAAASTQERRRIRDDQDPKPVAPIPGADAANHLLPRTRNLALNRRRMEWAIASLSIGGAILVLLAGAWLLPFDPRPQMLAAGLMALALWFVIGLHPDRA
jgi:hypothetical protein